MKYLSKYKIFENPNAIAVNNGIRLSNVIWYDIGVECITFSYFFGKFYFSDDDEDGLTHMDLWHNYKHKFNSAEKVGLSQEEYDRLDDKYNQSGKGLTFTGRGDLAGRLFTTYKIITFWEFPKDNNELKKVADDFKKYAHIDIWNDEWKIEILDVDENDEDKDYVNWGTWYPKDDKRIKYIPIKKYIGSGQRSEDELKMVHLATPAEKQKLKKKGWGKGFGSDKLSPLSWRQAKYVESYSKLFENPNVVFLKGGINAGAYYYYEGGTPFAVNRKSDEIEIGITDSTHGDSNLDNDSHKLPGRVWLEHKIISFWIYPPEKFKDYINQLEEKLKTKIWNNDWQLEIYQFEDDKIAGIDIEADNDYIFYDAYNRSDIDGYGEYKLIPIEDYIGSENVPEEEYAIHLLSAAEKQKLKAKGWGKGFGSDLTASDSKNPLSWRQAKYVESYSNFLIESPDHTIINKQSLNIQSLNYYDYDAYSFGYNEYGNMMISKPGMVHSETYLNKEEIEKIFNKKTLEEKREWIKKIFSENTDDEPFSRYTEKEIEEICPTEDTKFWDLKTPNIQSVGNKDEDEEDQFDTVNGYSVPDGMISIIQSVDMSREEMKYSGRLWKKHKHISFWDYPKDYKELWVVLKDIMKSFKRKGKKLNITDDWSIEVVTNEEGEQIPNDYKFWGDSEVEGNMEGYIETSKNIKIKDYMGSENFSEEERAVHLLNWKEKQELKKKGWGKGFGSDKLSPLAWRQAKYVENLKTNFDEFKLFENPDKLVYANPKEVYVTYHDNDAMAFAYHEGVMRVGIKELHHRFLSDLEDERYVDIDTGDIIRDAAFDFPGRLWLNRKIITFWIYPQPYELPDVLSDIKEAFDKRYGIKGMYTLDFSDPEWLIEVLSDDLQDPEDPDWQNNIRVQNRPPHLVPLSNYSGSKKRPDDELKIVHLASPAEKQALKAKGWGKGFGSDLSKGLAWKQAKYVENLKTKFDEFHNYRIFIDLDGVLTDFDGDIKKGFLDKYNKEFDTEIETGWEFEKEYGSKEFWSEVKKLGLEFWSNMNWMPDGKKLWNFVKTYNAEILSKPSSDKNSSIGKKIWCKRELDVYPILAYQKGIYAKPNHILIDDLEKNIISWNKAGGIGILHKNAEDTIKKLKKILGEPL